MENELQTKELVCIGCPLGCNISVEMREKEIVSITGNTCPRGADYATKELTNPKRIVTSLVRVKGGKLPVVPVKTASDIPKGMIFDCIRALKEVEVTAPVSVGDVVLHNVCDSGVDIVATRTVQAMKD